MRLSLTFDSKNGDSYKGNWFNDKEHGKGVYIYEKKRIEGVWEDGMLIQITNERATQDFFLKESSGLFSQAEESDYLLI